MNRPIRLLPAFMTVGVWTLASRILGLVREILIAALLGAGPAAEAFIVAFTLPNLFRRIFAEGAFNMAFIPLFAKKLEKDDGSTEFARDAMSGLATILIFLTLIAQFFMPAFVLAMASGYAEDMRFDLAVVFGRITFPYILFISIAALLSGVLNATGRFWAAAAAPVLLNILLVGAMLLAYFAGWDIASSLVWAVPIAGVAQMAMVWIAADRAGIRLIPRIPRLTPDLKRLAIIAAPAALAGGVVQINIIVGRQVASYYDGAVAWLYYADRFYQLPLGLVGVAIGVVLLPNLSRRLAEGDKAGGIEAVNRATEFSMALTIPAAIALVAVPVPLITVMFQRGGFTAVDTAATALAVAIYGAGLPAFVMQKVLSPIFFAREDTKTPFYYAVASMVVNAVLAIGLSSVIGFTSAAVGTTIAGWIMCAMLWRGASRIEGAMVMDARLRRALPRIVLASFIMGLAALGLVYVLEDALTMPVAKYGALLLLVAGSAAIYGAVLVLIGGITVSGLRAALRRS